MTTKRKQILKAIALAVEPTIDDLQAATGMPRNNLADNLKATVQDGLIERVKDEVLGLPAYKLTPKGRAWLEQDKDDIGSEAAAKPAIAAKNNVTPQPAVGKNTGSKAVGPRVAGGSMSADPLPTGNAVTAPPDQPQKAPVDLASADVMDLMQRNADLDVRLNSAGKSIVEFCEWLATTVVPHAGKGAMAYPTNLAEARMVIKLWAASQKIVQSEVAWRTLTDAHKELGMSERDVFIGIPEKIRDLKTMLHDRQESFSKACAEVRALEDRINVMTCQMEDSAAKLFASNKKAARWIEFCEWLAFRAKVRVPMNLHESKQVIESWVKSQPSAKAEVRALEDRINVMTCQLDDANNEAARLKSENIALSTLNASMPGFGATFAALKQSDLPAGVTLKTPQPQGYVIRSAGQQARFAKSHKNAKSAAMWFARSNGAAQVYALIPAGKAVAGAEWKA